MNNEIKINVPEGMEIDKENSTFECIKFKPKWVPKRGDFAAAGRDHSQIILVAEYTGQGCITGFNIKPLALLSKNGLSFYSKGSCVPTLWVLEEASASEENLLIETLNEQGYVYDPNDPRVIYKKEEELPKTWEEFCESNPIEGGEYYINSFSQVRKANTGFIPRNRECFGDANSFPSKEYAEAMLALCKLIQLRDCYNDGWKPNWNEESFKYVIRFYNEDIYKDCALRFRHLLAFKTQESRDAFYNNFEDLIKEAKLLL